jgi:lipopolysaccharide export system permease protein
VKLWQRYFFRKVSLTFFFILFCLFAVYVLVDLSVNGVRFFAHGTSIGWDVLVYYCLQFSMQLDLFLPLGLLLTTIKTLFDLNSHLEIVALQTAGLSRKQLLLPFFFFAGFLSLAGYANHEWIAPSAVKDVNAFKRSKAKKLRREKTVQSIPLDDGSELVYQTYDANTNEFFDVFWIRSANDIWSMKSLSFKECPTGLFTNHITRNHLGLLEKTESFAKHAFGDMPTSPVGIPGEIAPFEGRSLSALFRESRLPTAEQPSVQTHLHRKLALPLLPLLAVFACSPFAMTFSRHRKVIGLVSGSLFGFAIFMTLYDSLLLLGENRMTSPIASMWLPILTAFTLFGWRFWKFR